MTTAGELLDQLRAIGLSVRKQSSGWMCQCPAHEDQNPSLSVKEEGPDGLLVHCFAGCTFEQVLTAVGLFGEHRSGRSYETHTGRAPRVVPLSPRKPGRHFPNSGAAVSALVATLGEPLGCWEYRDAAGQLVGLVLRWDLVDGKTYRPVSKRGDGWVIGAMENPPLYRLPEIAESQTVYVVEGEKAADAGWAMGLATTTSVGGSNAAAKTDWGPISGKHVVICPDRDDTGAKFGEVVLELVKSATLATSGTIGIIHLADQWPELPRGGDLADAVEAEAGDLEKVKALVEELAARAEDRTPPKAKSSARSFEPFPVDVLPAQLCRYVSQGAASIGCDSSFVALPLLSTLATSIGACWRVRLKPDWTEPAIVWTLLVGESGSAKSPAIKFALAPLQEVQSQALEEYAATEPTRRALLAAHEERVAKWAKTGGVGDPPEEPDLPSCPRWIMNDVTIEAVARLLQAQPNGLLLARDEASGWIKGFDRYSSAKGAEVGQWLSMYDGDSLIVDRKSSDPLCIPVAAVSVIGGIQPGILRRVISGEHSENGFAARFLMARPPRVPARWTDAHVADEVKASVRLTVKRLLDRQGSEPGHPQLVELGEAAQRRFIEFYNSQSLEIAELDESLAPMWNKHIATVGRLALVLYLARQAEAERPVGAHDRVDTWAVEGAIRLVRWFGGQARMIVEELNETKAQREGRELLAKIRRWGGKITPRELVQKQRRLFQNVGVAMEALDALVEAGSLVLERPPIGSSGGRPSKLYVLPK